MELAAEFLAGEVQGHLPPLKRLGRVPLAARVGPAIPQHHRAGAVVIGRDDALKLPILHRVILDQDRQALVRGIERRPLGDRP
jgi:hypothetical protein